MAGQMCVRGGRLFGRQGVERDEQRPQQSGERALVGGAQRGEQVPLTAEQIGQRVVGLGPALVRQRDQCTAPVPWIGLAAYQPLLRRAGRSDWSSCPT